MLNNLIYILPGITLLLFISNIFYKGNTVSSVVLFILAFLPLMDLKITPEAFGGFKTFDAVCFYSLVFLFKDFSTIDLKHTKPFYLFLFILVCIITLLGGLASEFPANAFINVIKLLPVFIFSRFLIVECFKDETFYLKAVNALKISYVIALGFLLIQRVVGLGFTFYPELGPNTIDPAFGMIRYPGIFYDSQASGQFLAMGSFLFLFIPDGTSRKMTLLNYLVFVLAIAGIALAGSRAAFGGFAMGLLVVFFLAARKYRVYGFGLIVTSIVLFIIISPKSGIFERAGKVSEDYLFRKSIWTEAIKISNEHPYLGIGYGNYQNYVMRHAQDQYLEIDEGKLLYFSQPENGYLKIMVELGLFGFVIYLLFALVPLIKGFIYCINNYVDKRISFLMASLISLLVAFNTVYSIWDNRLLIMAASMIIMIIAYPLNQFNDDNATA